MLRPLYKPSLLGYNRREVIRTPIETARDILCDVTPLSFDCGSLCQAACCHSEGGMLLLPGEERLYNPLPQGFSITQQGDRLMLKCSGFCHRNTRPFACRIFPLIPRLSALGGLVWGMDPRGRGLCPLIAHGKQGLAPAFLTAADKALAVLSENQKQLANLRELAQLGDAYREMIRCFRL